MDENANKAPCLVHQSDEVLTFNRVCTKSEISVSSMYCKENMDITVNKCNQL
jgi:hypothetical protein